MPTYWEDLSWIEFQKKVPEEFATAIIPIGTIEGHGVGPLGTDNLIPIDIVRAIADDCRALICPPVHYGQVRGLAGYPGSLSIEDDIFAEYCASVFRSIASWGFDSLIIINGHGGNTESLKEAAWDAHNKTGMKILVVDWWALAAPVCEDVYGHAGGHAGTDENAYIQAIRPETVHADMYTDDLVYAITPGVAVYPYPGPVLVGPTGEGTPDFDPEKAQRYRDGAVIKVREFCQQTLARWDALGL